MQAAAHMKITINLYFIYIYIYGFHNRTRVYTTFWFALFPWKALNIAISISDNVVKSVFERLHCYLTLNKNVYVNINTYLVDLNAFIQGKIALERKKKQFVWPWVLIFQCISHLNVLMRNELSPNQTKSKSIKKKVFTFLWRIDKYWCTEVTNSTVK